mmetsp:Transcript_107713/g.214041  ORF Transcript_107713/g.214041 Transcript_107713/m.214041 type:complete len:291 (+) Transcript_107713:66-938(+)
MNVAPLLAAPGQEYMHPKIGANFNHHDSMLVKQTAKGCCQECFGCEAKSEYKISAMDWGYLESTSLLKEGAMSQPDLLYAIENSSFCMRLCWRDGRGFTLKVSEGSEAGGDRVATFKKPCGCPLYFNCTMPADTEGNTCDLFCPCCCFLPKVVGTDPDGKEINTSVFLCDKNCCVPKLGYTEKGRTIYILRPETCCFDCCVKPKFGGRGRKKFSVPFYFWDPATKQKVENPDGKNPQITKVWSGMKRECCTSADTFATFFPTDVSASRKAGLIGLTLLLDFCVFERQGQP